MSLPPSEPARPQLSSSGGDARRAERARPGWLLTAIAFTVAALMLAACGGAEPSPTPAATPTPTSEPTAPAAPGPSPTLTAAAWRSDLPTGPAAGKPLLLYFFATW